jgi:hypothetical protein
MGYNSLAGYLLFKVVEIFLIWATTVKQDILFDASLLFLTE